MAARSLIVVAAAVTPALSMSSIEERFERLEARVRALEEQNAQLQAGRPLDAPTAAAKVAAGVSARGEVGGGMGRRLSEPTCCRWTPSDECGSDTTEGCSMLHEYLETKTTTHEFAAVETCLGGTDHSNFKASFHGMDGNVSLSYGNSQVTSFKTPLKVTHAQSCSSTPPTLSLQLNTVADGTFTVGHVDVGAALKQPKIAPRFPNNALLGSSSDARNVIILEGSIDRILGRSHLGRTGGRVHELSRKRHREVVDLGHERHARFPSRSPEDGFNQGDAERRGCIPHAGSCRGQPGRFSDVAEGTVRFGSELRMVES